MNQFSSPFHQTYTRDSKKNQERQLCTQWSVKTRPSVICVSWVTDFNGRQTFLDLSRRKQSNFERSICELATATAASAASAVARSRPQQSQARRNPDLERTHQSIIRTANQSELGRNQTGERPPNSHHHKGQLRQENDDHPWRQT